MFINVFIVFGIWIGLGLGLIGFLCFIGYVLSGEPYEEEDIFYSAPSEEPKHKYTIVYNLNGEVKRAFVRADSKEEANQNFILENGDYNVVAILKKK